MMTYTKRRPARRPDFRERLAQAGRKLAYRLDHPRFLEDMVKPEEDTVEDGATGGVAKGDVAGRCVCHTHDPK